MKNTTKKEAFILSNCSPANLLSQFKLGEPFSVRRGICCYPATDKDNGNRYVAKVISIPEKPSITDAFLLSGTFPSIEKVNAYYKDQARELCKQGAILNALSHSKYFTHMTSCQITDRKEIGYDVWLLSPYRRSLAQILTKSAFPRELIIKLGLQLCSAAIQCREAGFLYIGMKPENIFISADRQFQLGDIGFVSLSSLPYLALPVPYYTVYTPKECHDCFASISNTTDTFGIGAVLYHALTGGKKPDCLTFPPATDDKELSDIIIKACDPEPSRRWYDPLSLGQALQEIV